VLKTNPALPGRAVARLTTAPASDQQYVYLSAAAVGDWIVTERAIGPATLSMVGDLFGEGKIITAIGDLAKAKRPAPTVGASTI
jgi:hypothetical protein